MSSLRRSGSFLLISLMILVSAAAIDTRRSDVNGNGVVEMGDIDIISQHFNETVSEPYPAYDVTMDGIVDIGDMTLTGQHFNESIPISSIISSGDGLKLKLGENGTIEGISINDTTLPMLTSRGGFSFREVLTTPPNLIANSGFESGAATPLNWSFVTSNGSTPAWDTISRTGARSIKISIPGTTNNRSGYPKSDLMEAEPLAYYTLSAWLKAEGAGGKNAPAVRVVELDSDRKWITQTNLVFGKGTYDWTQKKLTFRTGINTSYLYVYANIWDGYGTVWLDDVELSSFFGPTTYLNGALTQNLDGTVTQRARANDIDFTFYYIPKDRYIELQGKMQDLRGEDRALQVMYNLPLNASGWRWGDYIRGSRVINGSTHFENVYKIGDVRTQSTYPFASIDNNTHGMSIAVPMDVPRIYRKGYDLSEGYSIQYDFGLSNQTLKIGPGHANFTFVVYKTDEPEWGFRSVVKKYYKMYPGFFEKRNEREGTWTREDPENIPNAEDFGFQFYQSWNYPNIANFKKHNVYFFRYDEPWGVYKNFEKKPTYTDLVDSLQNNTGNGSGEWSILTLDEINKAILNSAIFDENGNYPFSDSFWGWEGLSRYNYPTNPNPEIPGENRYKLYEKIIKQKDYNYINNWHIISKNNTDDISWDLETSHSGNSSVKISRISSQGVSSYWKSDTIDIKPNTTYYFSAWGKTENVTGTKIPIVHAAEMDINFRVTKWNDIYFGSEANNWTEKNKLFIARNDTTNVYFYIDIPGGVGTFWVDDIILSENNTSSNLVRNSGFEENAQGNNTYYTADGISLDSIANREKWGIIENYRKEQWNLSTFPLIFSYSSKKVILLGLFSNYELIYSTSNKLKNNEKLLMGNFDDGGAYSFYGHLFNILGSEITDIPSDEISALKRTLSYHKSITDLLRWHAWGDYPNKDEILTHNDMENYVKNEMFYGVFPGINEANKNLIYWNNESIYERDRTIFTKNIPLIRNISYAGWEPITYAKIDHPDIKIERYGSLKNKLYFVLKNENNSYQNGLLVIDISNLDGFGKKLIYSNSNSNVQEAIFNENYFTLPVNISSKDVLIYKFEVQN